jgi:GNAT superfamily N-acetyltransferase
MKLEWVHEPHAVWDSTKARIIGSAPRGVLKFDGFAAGDLLPGEWWRVQDGDRTVGYGWVEFNWSDGEVLLAVDPERQHEGVGGFILARLGDEARARGVNHLYNVIPVQHPQPAWLAAWLEKHGYKPQGDGVFRTTFSRR